MHAGLRWLLETAAYMPFAGGLLRAVANLAAVGGNPPGTVTSINTTQPGISGGPITTAGTLVVQWNGGQVSTLGPGLTLAAGTLNSAVGADAPSDSHAYGRLNAAWTQVLPLAGGTMTGALNVTAAGGSVARSVQANFGDVANVLDFGADPTMASDSSAAFNAAAASISASGYYKSVYVPAGKYRIDHTINLINGQELLGDSRATSWLYADGNFSLAQTAFILIKSGTQFMDAGPAIRNLGITMVQPTLSTTPRASCIQYPPVISCQANCGRIQIDHVRIGGAWNGITDNGNNVVFDISDLELGALNVGISIGVGATGPQDFCHLHALHFWNFDCPFTAFSDGNTICMDIGRCDGLNVTDCCNFMGQIIVESAGSGTTITHFTNLMLDTDTASCTFNGGLHHHISNCYSASGANRVRPAITVNGSTTVRISNWYSHNSSPFPMWDVQAGWLVVENAQVRHNNLNTVVGRTSAGNALLSVHNAEVWTGTVGAYTQPIFQQGGGASRMKLDNITVDNIGNATSGTAVSYANDVLGNMLGAINLPSGWTVSGAGGAYTPPNYPLGIIAAAASFTTVQAQSATSAATAQMQLMPPSGTFATESKLRFWGTFPSGDNSQYMSSSLRSGYSAFSWTASYLDVWLTNAANNPANDANTAQVARFAPSGLTLNGALAVAGQVSGAGVTSLFASPPAIGGTTPAAGSFTTLSATGAPAFNTGGGAGVTMIGSNSNVNTQQLALNSAANVWRLIGMQTAGVARWSFGSDGTAEGPANSNNGSNFNIYSNKDDGTSLATPLSIARATGVVTLSNGLVLSAGVIQAVPASGVVMGAAGPNIRSGAGAAAGTQPSGSIWMRTDGTAGNRMYVSQGGGTWVAIASV